MSKGDICNLTQHLPTPEQTEVGVYNLPDEDWGLVKKLMTFNSLEEARNHAEAAEKIADIASKNGCKKAMIGGAPYLMPRLENALLSRGIDPLYAFSKRVVQEQKMPDGSVVKKSIFKFEGFVEP